MVGRRRLHAAMYAINLNWLSVEGRFVQDAVYTFLSFDFSGLVIGVAVVAFGAAIYALQRSVIGRVMGALIALAGLILAGGGASQLFRLAQLDSKFPPPGQIVEIDDHKAHILAEGPSNGPAIVWLGGGHSGGLAMAPVHIALKKTHRSILIDRLGTGWSDPGPFPRTTAREADEIMATLRAAGEAGPFVFAGHSFGGLLAANIARRYPDEIAALVLLDATPLDVVVYGADKKGLGSLWRMERVEGLKRVFGFYASPQLDKPEDPLGEPFKRLQVLGARAGIRFANASIYEELDAAKLAPRAWETFIADGELGEIPLYLVAPKQDPGTDQYVETIVGSGAPAARFRDFLYMTRERYMAASSNAHRIVAPEGTGHNFIYEDPAFLIETMKRIHEEVGSATISDEDYAALTTSWPGPYGGLPPFDIATPSRVEAAYLRAAADWRAEINAIADDPGSPDFENTVLALERSGAAFARIDAIFQAINSTAANEDVRALAARLAPLRARIEDEIAFNRKLFDRIRRVREGVPASAPNDEAARLTRVTYDRLRRRGAELDADGQVRLTEINARLGVLRSSFAANAAADEATLIVFADDKNDVAGLPQPQLAAAKNAAEAAGRPEAWAFPMNRPTVWPALTHLESRALREKIWRVWSTRGGNDGPNDNRPVINEILKLRGEKAKLLGYRSFAEYQTSARMAGSPKVALDMMMRTWRLLDAPTRAELAELQAIADEDGLGIELRPWDRLYYDNRLKREQFAYDPSEILPYFSLQNIIDAMFWAAGETFGYSFTEIDAAKLHDSVRVYEVKRNGEIAGVLYTDLFQREGKGPASWASQYRSYTNIEGKTLPVVALHSAVTPPADGQAALVPWERANVIFHEFGHTLHTLSNSASYASLGSLAAPWDFIEAPSLLNEQWLQSDEVMDRFLRHHRTGAAIPPDLKNKLRFNLKRDRVFTVTLGYLATAIVDMRLHQIADGRAIDAIDEEGKIVSGLDMPPAIDLALYAPHAFHTFSEQYAAGMYTYLWSDVLAADILSAFEEAPGGLYDKAIARKYFNTILSAGNRGPINEAFRAFRGRDPDPDVLLRRFGLIE